MTTNLPPEFYGAEKYFKEAEKVQQISVDFSNAGYDIESFVGKAENLERPDKFIEVKGTTAEQFRFFWSKNEIKQAQKLGNRYWIYFVANVNKEDRSGEIIETIGFRNRCPILNIIKRIPFTLLFDLQHKLKNYFFPLSG